MICANPVSDVHHRPSVRCYCDPSLTARLLQPHLGGTPAMYSFQQHLGSDRTAEISQNNADMNTPSQATTAPVAVSAAFPQTHTYPTTNYFTQLLPRFLSVNKPTTDPNGQLHPKPLTAIPPSVEQLLEMKILQRCNAMQFSPTTESIELRRVVISDIRNEVDCFLTLATDAVLTPPGLEQHIT